MTKIHFPIFDWGLNNSGSENIPEIIAYHENLINNKKIYHNSINALDLNLKIKFDYYKIEDPGSFDIRQKISDNDHQQFIKKILNQKQYLSSFISIYQGSPDLTLKNLPKNTIMFADIDPGWYESGFKKPENLYDVLAVPLKNPELVNWVLRQNKFSKIYFLHSGLTGMSYYKKYLSKKDINKLTNFNFGNYKNYKNLNSLSFSSFVNKIGKNSLIILNIYADEVKEEFKLLLNHLNKLKKNVFVLELYAAIDHTQDTTEFGFLRASSTKPYNTIKELAQNYALSSSKKISEFKLSERESNVLYQIDIASLIFNIVINKNIKIHENNVVEQVKEQLAVVNGTSEVFIGNLGTICFDKNRNLDDIETNLVTYYKNKRRNINICVPFFKQAFKKGGKLFNFSVHYSLIDIINIDELDVSENLWNCEFIFEVITTHKDPIDLISFTNLHNRRQLYKKKLLSIFPSDYGYKTYVYRINANFSFDPDTFYFPFDKQNLYIEYTFNKNDYGVLHSVPNEMVDTSLHIDGWSCEQAYSGQKRHKNFVTKDVELNDEVEIERNSRFGIIFKRLDKMILLKTVIPILTLLVVNYYCVFISRENIIDNIILQVTIFLTGIALFFSTDKPQPLKFTLIDSIFSFFYLMTGTNILFTMTQDLFSQYLSIIRGLLIVLYPLAFILFIIFFIFQVKKSDVDLGIKS